MFCLGFILVLVQSLYLIEQISGHGYLADPPARSSAWLVDKDFNECCRDYNHIEMSCGGAYHQWVENGGKCSICGEAYDLQPKLLGVGDAMYLGKIVRTYTQGAVIPVTVILTANHLGRFEFRVCSIDNHGGKDATQGCLDLNILKFPDGLSEHKLEGTDMTVQVQVTLPPKLVCKHCVFQWKYITGNSWGTSADGKSCLGCGTENEEFYGCSDIAIVSKRKRSLITKREPIKPVTSVRKCTSANTFSQSLDISATMEEYCQNVCSNNCAADKINGNEVLYNGCIDSCDKLCVCE